MCFFKTPKMPDFNLPEKPTIQEIKAPEAQAPVFGTSENEKQDETSGKTGVSSLKLPPMPKLPTMPQTGANKSGFRV